MADEENTILTKKVRIRPDAKVEFIHWQAQLNAAAASFPGFISLEIRSSTNHEWVIIQRFQHAQNIAEWKQSKAYQNLNEELKPFLEEGFDHVEEEAKASTLKEGVTEVFITQVSPDKEEAYRNWIAKVHRIEAGFPGFRGMYVQAPTSRQSHNWITLLQFDTPENLDFWLSSSERQQVLQESESLITSLENHRVISPYAGWFAPATMGPKPAVWKQTMLILLVLFPIVMLEIKYLNPLLKSLNLSLATFIGNAISVSLVSWPLMPIATRALGWWLSPDPSRKHQINWMGTLIVLFLYLIEIILLWKLV